MNADELDKLHQLKQKGALTEAEFQRAKEELLQRGQSLGAKIDGAVNTLVRDENRYAMFLHLSQLLGLAVPVLGWSVPLILWLLKRDTSPLVDQHGKVVLNWILTELVVFVIGFILTVIVIGVPILFALLVLGIVFPIIGAVKAEQGKLWPYPLSFSFVK